MSQVRRASDDVEEETNTGQTGIEMFLGQHILDKGFTQDHPDPGRAWKHEELEVKGYEDLRRIWFLCLKERNMLLSVELFYQHQSETFGDFPHPGRLDRVETTMRRIKEVLFDRHVVATKIAWDEFQRRVSKNQYRFPAGPHPPPGYGETTKTIVCYSQRSMLEEDTSGFARTNDQIYEALKSRFELILNVTVKDVVETLTPRGEEREERLKFIEQKMEYCSRNLINAYDDLKKGWQGERDDLRHKGPYQYNITLEAEDAQAVLAAAGASQDEVFLLTVAADDADDASVHEKDFADDEHIVFRPTPLPPTQRPDEFYKHIMAREKWLMRAATRPAAHTPDAFVAPPTGIDPWSKKRRDHPNSAARLRYEFNGQKKAQYVDAPHPGTEIINRYNVPGEETR